MEAIASRLEAIGTRNKKLLPVTQGKAFTFDLPDSLREMTLRLGGVLIENSPSCIADMAMHLMPFLRSQSGSCTLSFESFAL